MVMIMDVVGGIMDLLLLWIGGDKEQNLKNHLKVAPQSLQDKKKKNGSETNKGS